MTGTTTDYYTGSHSFMSMSMIYNKLAFLHICVTTKEDLGTLHNGMRCQHETMMTILCSDRSTVHVSEVITSPIHQTNARNHRAETVRMRQRSAMKPDPLQERANSFSPPVSAEF